MPRNNRGVTLLEVMLAIVLIASSFSVLLGLFAKGTFVGGVEIETTSVSANLAQEKMEELKNKSFASIANEARAAVSGFSSYEREVAVSTVVTNLKQVTVNVYKAVQGGDVTTTLVTYISNI